jgi:hypothetical protein
MIDHVTIRKIKENEDGTGILFIGEVRTDPNRFEIDCGKAKYQGQLQLDDARMITAMQRKKAWATLNEIADHYGWKQREVHDYLKYRYMAESGEAVFSLSDCSMDTARRYISFLIELVIAEGIPMKQSAMNRVEDRPEDIARLMWLCLLYRRCPICGKPADLHHEDAIGMGRDRDKVDDSKLKKIALCRVHHTEAEAIGKIAFSEKYHVFGIIFDQKKIKRKFGSDLFD